MKTHYNKQYSDSSERNSDKSANSVLLIQKKDNDSVPQNFYSRRSGMKIAASSLRSDF
jgi:hypothetical protein